MTILWISPFVQHVKLYYLRLFAGGSVGVAGLAPAEGTFLVRFVRFGDGSDMLGVAGGWEDLELLLLFCCCFFSSRADDEFARLSVLFMLVLLSVFVSTFGTWVDTLGSTFPGFATGFDAPEKRKCLNWKWAYFFTDSLCISQAKVLCIHIHANEIIYNSNFHIRIQ